MFTKQTIASETQSGMLAVNIPGTIEFGVNNDANGFYFRYYCNGVSYRLMLMSDHGYVQKFSGTTWTTWKTLY